MLIVPSRKRAFSIERTLTAKQLVEQHTERVHIGTSIYVGGAVCLFGTHVLWGAEYLARSGQQGLHIEMLVSCLRDSEVNDLGDYRLTVGVRENVRRLQVPVDDTHFMGVLNRPAHIQKDSQARLNAQPVSIAVLRDAFAWNQLHGKERSTILCNAPVVNLGNERMVQ